MVSEDLYRFYSFNLLFYDRSLFPCFLPSCHKDAPAPADTNSLLAFIPYFLAHTASSICQCQVTMLINRSVLAAVKTRRCVVEARGSPYHLSSPWRAFPATEPHASDVFATYGDKTSLTKSHPLACVMDISTVFTFYKLQSGDSTFIVIRQRAICSGNNGKTSWLPAPSQQIVANKQRTVED